jgi:predicted HicB family RNase H-like nuclease|tara:strand:- start:1022 stop:1273 length:252 start_codon:yes stop_codon:yes gene_type:complete
MADYNRDEMRRQELRITSVDPPKKTSETFEIDISDDLFLRVAKEAHARDITFNDMVLSIVKDGLRDAEYRFEHNSKPQFLAEE